MAKGDFLQQKNLRKIAKKRAPPPFAYLPRSLRLCHYQFARVGDADCGKSIRFGVASAVAVPLCWCS